MLASLSEKQKETVSVKRDNPKQTDSFNFVILIVKSYCENCFN